MNKEQRNALDADIDQRIKDLNTMQQHLRTLQRSDPISNMTQHRYAIARTTIDQLRRQIIGVTRSILPTDRPSR